MLMPNIYRENGKKNVPDNDNFTKVRVDVVDDWSRKKASTFSWSSQSSSSSSSGNINNKTNKTKEEPRKLKSFNIYLTSEDTVQSVNEYTDALPDKIEGTYKYDFNIMDIHNLILKRFQYQRDHEINKLENELRAEECKINRKQNMVERKSSLRVISRIKKSIDDILTDKSFRDYIHKIQPLTDAYSLLGSISKIVSFAKNKRSNEEFEDEAPEGSENQMKRHQLILDFIEIARKYIQIDLIREVKEGNNCPACGTKLDDSMSSMDANGISVCSDCGIERISVVRTRFYQDNARTNNSGNNYEDRANFNKVLMRYQGKQHDKPPKKLYDILNKYFLDHETPKIDLNGDGVRKFVTPDYIRNNIPINKEGEKNGTSRSLMYKALKETGNSDYYDHINVILNEVWRWKLPDVSYLEDRIMEDYDASQRIYELLPKDRKSSLNSQFRLFKHLRRLGHPCKSKDFRIPTTHDILEFHNTMWSKMCEVLNWENLKIKREA